MTAKEFEKAYINARKKTPTLIRSVMKELKTVYVDATDKVIKDFLSAKGLAAERLESIESQLNAASATIAKSTQAAALDAVNKTNGLYSAITEDFLNDIISGTIVTPEGVKAMVVGINNRLVIETLTRMGQDGYTLSDRCWRVGDDYRVQINRLVASGQAQGRSVTEISRDIGDYVQGGRAKMVEGYTQAKYGNLVVKNVDWKALRLVRSEFGMSQKTAAVAQGEANPACTKMYNWVRIDTQQHDCECPGLAAGSPYKTEDVPGQPHPNCFCQVRPILMDLDKFESDLQRWTDGESVPYLDEWYAKEYQQP